MINKKQKKTNSDEYNRVLHLKYLQFRKNEALDSMLFEQTLVFNTEKSMTTLDLNRLY